jgi:hypothetical protein
MRINYAYYPRAMKRVLACILSLVGPFATHSAEIKKETPIAYYSITNLVEGGEFGVYTAALFRAMSEAVDDTVRENPDLFESQPVGYLIEILPDGCVRTLQPEEGDPRGGITQSIRNMLKSWPWYLKGVGKNIPDDSSEVTKLRFRVYPKCLLVCAEKTQISNDKVSLEGDVVLTYGKYKIKADHVESDPNKRIGSAEGAVLMNIANGEYIPKKGLTFVFRNDGSLRNYFWENN